MDDVSERTPLTHSTLVDGYDVIAVRNALHSLRLKAHRILALLSIFDALFCFLLWALVCQGFNGSFHGNYIYDSVVNFKFKSSLFDVICIAGGRCVFLLICYWTCRSTSSLPMIFSTTASTIFLLVKVFYYSFKADTHPTDYIVFIAAFILPWIESYVWVSRISPLNKKLAILYGGKGGRVTPGDIHQLLVEHRGINDSLRDMATFGYGGVGNGGLYAGNGITGVQQYERDRRATVFLDKDKERKRSQTEDRNDSSAFSTPTNDLEAGMVAPAPAGPPTIAAAAASAGGGNAGNGVSSTRRPPSIAKDPLAATLASLSPKDITYIREAGDALKFTYEIANNPFLWEKKREKSGVTISTYRDIASLHASGSYVLMMSEGLVMGSPAELFRFLYEETDSHRTWNKDIASCESIQRLDSHTDVVYTERGPRGTGGIITSRDFVEVRRWQKQQDGYVIATTSINHDACPPKRKHVRATSGYGGLILQTVEQQPRVTNLKWVLHMDMKITGILSARVQTDICTQFLVNYHENLRAFLEEQAKSQDNGLARSSSHHGNYA